jgi:hypothetical protein
VTIRSFLSRTLRMCASARFVGDELHPDSNDIRFAVITADRQQALERCLRSLISNETSCPERPILVADNGRTSSEATVSSLERAVGRRLGYVGAAARRLLTEGLAGQGCDAAAVKFALRSEIAPAIGANRNASLLFAAGTRLVSIDDDVVVDLSVPWSLKRGLRLTDGYEPRRFDFLGERDRLSVPLMGIDSPLAACHKYLGMLVDDVAAAERAAKQDVRAEWSSASGDSSSRRVRLTMSGFVGQDGMGSPTRLLALDGHARSRLLTSKGRYRRAYVDGRMARYVEIQTITPSVTCMTMCIGLDATDLLPPFFPGGRSCDTLFGVTLAKIDPSAAVMFTPEIVRHDSVDPRSRSEDSIRTYHGFRIAHLLSEMTAWAEVRGESTSERLTRIGDSIVAVATDGPLVFRRLCVALWKRRNAEMSLLLQRNRIRYRFAPDYWDQDVTDYILSLEEASRDDGGAIPVDVLGATRQERWEETRDQVLQYGRLLVKWPAIWDAARAARANGSGFSRHDLEKVRA